VYSVFVIDGLYASGASRRARAAPLCHNAPPSTLGYSSRLMRSWGYGMMAVFVGATAVWLAAIAFALGWIG
jgi:hypothetical protein